MEINRSFLDSVSNDISDNIRVLSSAIQTEIWNDGVYSSIDSLINRQILRNKSMINDCLTCIVELEKLIPLSENDVLNSLCKQYMEGVDSVK